MSVVRSYASNAILSGSDRIVMRQCLPQDLSIEKSPIGNQASCMTADLDVSGRGG